MADNGQTGSAIKAQGLTKWFGNRLALKGVDLDVKRGERVVIFGPNGAGKTTLLKILATIMTPSSGSLTINALDARQDPEAVRRLIGVVGHQTFLYGNLTVFENLDFYSRLYCLPRARERIIEVAEQVEMTVRLSERVNTLSRGMQQRVSIARCLLHRPAVILLDEPETGLDQQANALLWQAIRADAERTVVLATHNLEHGLEIADRLLILAQGKIVYERPAQALDLDALKAVYRTSTKVMV